MGPLLHLALLLALPADAGEAPAPLTLERAANLALERNRDLARSRTLLGRNEQGLRAAEAEFSALANRIGVGAAFAQRGTPESLNAGRPSDGRFIRGADAIAQVVAGGAALDAPSTITWSADTAIVATSNDLGITFGVIRPKQSPATGTSFFTIWRKSNGVWRYVAE